MGNWTESILEKEWNDIQLKVINIESIDVDDDSISTDRSISTEIWLMPCDKMSIWCKFHDL